MPHSIWEEAHWLEVVNAKSFFPKAVSRGIVGRTVDTRRIMGGGILLLGRLQYNAI